jgi:hypothetical protein
MSTDGTSDQPPQIKDHPGRWDERFAMFIVATPFVLLLLGGSVASYLLVVGRITVDAELGGTVSLQPLVLPIGAAFGLVFVLSVMKIYGIAPVEWVANAARDYNPPRRGE